MATEQESKEKLFDFKCPVCGFNNISACRVSEPFTMNTVIGSKARTLFEWGVCNDCGIMLDIETIMKKMKQSE